jgi:hypothetical protein
MKVELRRLSEIRPYPGNPRTNDDAVDAVAASIKEFGFRQAIVVDADGVIVVGHTRYKAAQKLGLEKVPVHVATDLTPEQIKAYRIADNKTAELSDWNYDLLPIELPAAMEATTDETLRALLESLVPSDAPALRQMDTKPPPRMTWVLIGVPTVRFGEIADQIEMLAKIPGIVCETSSNNGDEIKEN